VRVTADDRYGGGAMTISPRFWRAVTLPMRLDMATGIAMAAALFLFVTWH